VKRPKKSGTVKKGKPKPPKPFSSPLTKDSFAKTVEIMPDGSRKVHLPPDTVALLDNQREMFRAKFGREPAPSDPIFFDPDADTPKELPPLDPNVMEAVAVEAGVRPEVAFAVAKTGVFLMEKNEHLYSDEDKADFLAAIEEYRERSKKLDS
jgi:hypothetical protein